MFWTWGWTDPTWDVAFKRMFLSTWCVRLLSLDLRLSFVLKMWIDLLRGCQTLLRNWVVIKVAFGFVMKHAVRHCQSRWDLPLSNRERYLWAPRVIGSRNAWPCYLRLRVNLVRDSVSQIEKERSAWSMTEYREAKGLACTWHCDGSSDMIFVYV